MLKCINFILLALLAVGAFQLRQETVRLETILNASEIERTRMRIEIEKMRDESMLRRTMVSTTLSKAAEPIPNMLLTVTAYSCEELKEYPGQQLLTASSTKPKEGGIAVSRDLFQQGWVFGKKVYIKNHGVFVITDLMADRKTKCVDIFMNDQERALQFGKKKIEVVLLDV